jgi:hypothetical protein
LFFGDGDGDGDGGKSGHFVEKGRVRLVRFVNEIDVE